MNVSKLEFDPDGLPGNKRARMAFDNGYALSIIQGRYAFCDDSTYEVAITLDGRVCYDTEFTDDVLSYQTEDDIRELAKGVSALPRPIKELE